MNGFIDLTFEHGGRFYFADWKSNWLGPDTRAYHPATIAAEMQRNFYTLQLCLYSVALHRYLRMRKPGYDFEQHFGGAFYIFLRGIDPAQPENGVHFQRLSRELGRETQRDFRRMNAETNFSALDRQFGNFLERLAGGSLGDPAGSDVHESRPCRGQHLRVVRRDRGNGRHTGRRESAQEIARE